MKRRLTRLEDQKRRGEVTKIEERREDKLRALLTSEMVPITEMQHDGICAAKTIDEEGENVIA
jgi:hypothetical protein